MGAKNPKGENRVYQMFELAPLVDAKGSLKILIKSGLAEQSGYRQAAKQKEKYKFYSWYDVKEEVLKIKAVERKSIDLIIQKGP